MTWEDTRTATGATSGAIRQVAHGDDAKRRRDESTNARPRARWLVPAAVALVVVVIVGGTTVALTRGGGKSGDGSTSSTSGRTGAGADQTGSAGSSTKTPTSYNATIRCVQKSELALSCDEFPGVLDCPEGQCAIGVATNVELFDADKDAELAGDSLIARWRPGDPGFAAEGDHGEPTCTSHGKIDGVLNGDGSYTVNIVENVSSGCGGTGASAFVVTLTPA